jgi:uncharacterized protein
MEQSGAPPVDPALARVQIRWGVRIPLRDGVHLNATLYLPHGHTQPSPAVFTLTPYIGQTYHDQALYFAAHGYPFLTVDVRGRGDSEGVFRPLINEARDGFDVVEWLAQQPYCDGKVGMWGGSYAGYDQWATAKEFPPHLATIVPAAAPCIGIDFPIRGNTTTPYLMQWLTLVRGRTSQDRIFWNNERFWGAKFREWFEAGAPFRQLDTFFGYPSESFQEWIAHPQRDAYWDAYNPTEPQYAGLSLPILTITGLYDGNQPGALTHYRQHMQHATPAARARHHLVIGPWDHAGTRVPRQEFCGLKVGPASLVDLQKLHREWYAWTMQGGPRPAFLQQRIAYYVMVAEKWRYADSLEQVTLRSEPHYLHSTGNPTCVFSAGALLAGRAGQGGPDCYVSDPRDLSLAELESTLNPASRTDQRMIHAAEGKQLVYHSAPFAEDTEITGFFRLCAWISIDQPDTDIRATVHAIDLDGAAVQLCTDVIRARYRESLRAARLVDTTEPLLYEFQRFSFVACVLQAGHRLRLVIGPVNSIFSQKNYNSGRPVSEESMQDARTVTVRVFHDDGHPSALHVPYGRPDDRATSTRAVDGASDRHGETHLP